MHGKCANCGSDHGLHTSKKGATAFRDNASFFAHSGHKRSCKLHGSRKSDGANERRRERTLCRARIWTRN